MDLVYFCDRSLRACKVESSAGFQYLTLRDLYERFVLERDATAREGMAENLTRFRSCLVSLLAELESSFSIKYKVAQGSSESSMEDFLYRYEDGRLDKLSRDAEEQQEKGLAELSALEKATRDLDVEKVLQSHIQALHDYNEMKDAGQILLGQLALLEGTTVKAMYADFGLSEQD